LITMRRAAGKKFGLDIGEKVRSGVIKPDLGDLIIANTLDYLSYYGIRITTEKERAALRIRFPRPGSRLA
jgi:hypothetical protein